MTVKHLEQSINLTSFLYRFPLLDNDYQDSNLVLAVSCNDSYLMYYFRTMQHCFPTNLVSEYNNVIQSVKDLK